MEQKNYDVTVFGCATSVYVLKTHQLPCAGKSIWIDSTDMERFNGGVGFNISMGLSALGLRVRPILSCSDLRMSNALKEELCARYGWPEDGILEPLRGSDHRCYMFQDDNKDHMTIVYRSLGAEGADGDPDAVPAVLRDDYIDESRMVILASPRPVNTAPILQLLRKKNCPFVFSYRNDPTIFPPDVLREILVSASVLFMNQAEAEEVVSLLHLSAIEDLFRIGKVKTMVNTIGKRGSIVFSREAGGVSSFVMPVTENGVGNVDAVGAGDSYLAGFMYGYMNHKSLRLCAQYGSTMSSFVIEKEGSTTNLPTLEQMRQRNGLRPDAVYE